MSDIAGPFLNAYFIDAPLCGHLDGCIANYGAGCLSMSRWQTLIDSVFMDLETLVPRAERFRIEVNEKISEGEMLATHSDSATSNETPELRRQDFRMALWQALVARQNSEPHKVWKEALLQLNKPGDSHPLTLK
jgi:hypothetical protein